MRRNTYNYSLLKSYQQKTEEKGWVRIWHKQHSRGLKYKYKQIMVTYSNALGVYIEKKFKNLEDLRVYMEIPRGLTQYAIR